MEDKKYFRNDGLLDKNCAQKYREMYKNPLKYQKISQSEKPHFPTFYRENCLFSALSLFPSNLHTVEVAGSNPA